MKTTSKLFILGFLLVTLAGSADSQTPSPTPAPQMTEELMSRLIKRTLDSKKDYALNAEICSVFYLCSDGKPIPAKQISKDDSLGYHAFIVSLSIKSPIIVICLKRERVTEIYLADNRGNLLDAAIWDSTGIYLIAKAKAMEKFKKEMDLYVSFAQTLPPK